MGGRGTFAAGNPVPYTYEVDTDFSPNGKFNGIKVLKGIEGSGKHGLPESSHSSMAYLKMNKDGTFNMMRIYDEKHNLRIEIAYHNENQLGKGKILHYHVYDSRFSSTNDKDGFKKYRSSAIKIHRNTSMYKNLKKFLKGVK